MWLESERGQIATWMTLTIAGALLALGVSGFARLATASDQDSQLQIASDAAALAGAQSIARDAHRNIVRQLLYGDVSIHSLGYEKAKKLAAKNDTRLTYYRYDPRADRVEVEVTSNKRLESGDYETAAASAKLGKKILPCTIPRRPSIPTETPTPTPTLSPGETPPPPPIPDDITRTARCGDFKFDFTFPGAGGPGVPDLDAIERAFNRLRIEPTLAD